MSLIVTGSIGIDTVITPTGRADEVLGGSTTYFAAAASFFGPVRLVGAVGEDFEDRHLEAMGSFASVDLAGLERRAGSQTFRWTGEYEANMNVRNTLDVQLNVLAEPIPPVPDTFRDSTHVFLANTHPANQIELIDSFGDAELIVADTMDLYINTTRDVLDELMRRVHGLVINDSEAELLTGESNVIRAADAILGMGPAFVVIKKGEHGCMLRHAEGLVVLPAYPARDVVDPTGAGDSFAGGMMGYLASIGKHDLPALRRALGYGTVTASFNIESFTLDRLSQISRADIDRRFDEFAACARVE
ncbi:MAG: sugar kinase [Planctomycetaceae bacterium]|nr:sugar kinase [Planctomycetaceae bacterium]